MSADIITRLGWDNTEAAAGAKRAETIAKNFASKTEGILGSIGKNAIANIAPIFAAGSIVALGKEAVLAAANYEDMRNSLVSLSGSAAIADYQLQALRQEALKPGLEFEALVSGSARFQAVGFSARQAQSIVAELGNTLALSGAKGDDLNQVVDALATIASSGDISDNQIDRLTERSGLLAQALEKAFGASTAAGIRETGVGVQEMLLKLRDVLSEVDRASESTTSNLKNVREEITDLKVEIGEKLTPGVNGLSVGFLRVANVGATGFEKLTNAVSTAYGATKVLFGGMKDESVIAFNETLIKQTKEYAAANEKLGEAQAKARDVQIEAEQKLKKKLSAENLKAGENVTQLRPRVEDEKARTLDITLSEQGKLEVAKARQLDLEQQIAQIQAAGPPSASAEEKILTLTIEREKALQTILRIQEAMDGKRKSALNDIEEQNEALYQTQLDDEQKLQRAREKLAAQDEKIRSINTSGLDVIDAEKQGLDNLRERLKTLQEISGLEQKVEEKRKDDEKKVTSQNQAKQEIQDEIAVMSLRAQGMEKKAVALQKEITLAKEAKDIRDATGLSEEKSLNLAKQKLALQEQIDRRANGSGDRKIRGYSQSQRTYQDDPFRNLNAAAERNAKPFFEGKLNTPGLDALKSKQSGNLLNEKFNPLASAAERNNATQAAAANPPQSFEQRILEEQMKTNEILNRALN